MAGGMARLMAGRNLPRVMITRRERRVAYALKPAGPSAQPSMLDRRSSSVSANIRLYSSNDLPQGTTLSKVNPIRRSAPRARNRVGLLQTADAGGVSTSVQVKSQEGLLNM